MGDQEFLDFVAQTDMVEANLGQLAQTAGSAQVVKDYGKMLADDHTGDFHTAHPSSSPSQFEVAYVNR